MLNCMCSYSGERLVEELAPELAPMLTALEMPANFVPVTNAVLSEMARRGVSSDKILATLRAMGGELPLGTLRMLQWAQRTGVDVRVLSDCNTLFIGHILTGAALSVLFFWHCQKLISHTKASALADRAGPLVSW